MVMIETKELCKNFKDKKRGVVNAVDHVTFSCRQGEVYGLLGPNGAGKTTTLRILSTALKPSSGTALINGVDVAKEPQKVRSHIGFLSGNTGLYGRLTAKEMVEYFGRLYGMSDQNIKSRTDQLFTMLDMNSFANTQVKKDTL